MLYFILLLITSSVDSKSLEGEDVRIPDPYQLELATSQECLSDINRICGAGIVKTNFQVISCLQDGHKDLEISEDCQHLIYIYKRNLTIDQKYEGAVKQVCSFMITQVKECQELTDARGHLIPCLIENLNVSSSGSNDRCTNFLARLKPVVFSDYRIIYKFSEACQNDIERLKCGRMDKPVQDPNGLALHQQGKVLTCLFTEITRLDTDCKHEILRVAELQADDYHNDRQLFLACRHDRERFCSQVDSGEGRVYSCLFKNKMDNEMSQKCREMLTLRQKLQQEDYKVNMGLTKACHNDILDNHCFRHMDRIAGFTDARLSAVLLCLEDAMRNGKDIKPECRIELKEVRRSLMEDFAINPALVVDCSNEIEVHCGGGLAKNGRTIHCLMDLARPRLHSDTKKEFVVEMSARCKRSLEDLLVQADVGENYAVDPVLGEACEPIVRIYCDHVRGGDGRIMTCLLESLHKPKMSDKCREALMEVQYFLMRDFRLDNQLYKACKADSVRLCKAPMKWYLPNNEKDVTLEMGYLIFACLFRYIDRTSEEPGYKPVNLQCASEIKRVMRERARSVNLDPDIERECLTDLSRYCTDKSEKNEEMLCLEEHFETLERSCMDFISEFIKNADKNPSLNSIFLDACEPFWQKHCQGGDRKLTMDIVDEEFEKELMGCLIENKNHPEMNHKCLVGIDYHQLATLQDYHFSHKFKTGCKHDIDRFCPDKTDKWLVVTCLANMVLNDTLLTQKQRVSLKCREELDAELLQRNEDIQLDPELQGACKDDVATLCKGVTNRKAAVLQCLSDNLKDLSRECHKKMFKRLEMEAIDPKTDYFLYSKCKPMIKKFCIDELKTPEMLFSCLQRFQDDDKFDEKCKEAVLSRSHVFARDIRLNRELSRACYSDVMEFCKTEVSQQEDDLENEGVIVECLKKVFVQRNTNKKGLTETCESHVRTLIRMSALDIKLDVVLMDACVHEIARMCESEMQSNRGSETDGGKVENCLKAAFAKEEITLHNNHRCYKEVERLVEESIVDIHADPKLSKRCSIDLVKFCSEVPRGEGRKLDCLLVKLNENKLTDECTKMLETRSKLWKKVKHELPSNLQEVVQMVSSSPAVNYFLIVFVVFVCFIFVGGLCFGRLTKRVKREMKNR